MRDAAEPQPELRALVEAARAGDRDSFGALYQRYARMVHGLLLAHLSPGEAEDLTQDVFLQALRTLGSLREPAAFGPWLATIARHRAHDRRRTRRPTTTLAEDAAVVTQVPHAEAQAEAHTILAAIQQLPEAYREPLVLRLCEGMTGPEIAARTGLAPESVRVNLHRGMKKLRERLGEQDPSGVPAGIRSAERGAS